VKNNTDASVKLIKILKREFPDTGIINLENITKKISVITKVRSGKKLNANNYDEVTLSALDTHGVLIPHKRGEEFKTLASQTSINSQSLNAGDILISYRGVKHYSVGRVGTEYERTIVGNNGAIRIQFNDDQDIDVSVMVHAYLELEYVQDYLKATSNSTEYSRQLLSPDTLLQLPIPEFHIYSRHSFAEIHEGHLDIISEMANICESASSISEHLQSVTDKDLKLYNSSLENFRSFLESKKRVSALLTVIEGSLVEIESLKYYF